jgi:hypothetical protein
MEGGKPLRLIVRRVPPSPGSQLALYVEYSYHAFTTNRQGEMLILEADHRAHAEVENTIRDLKYGMGLNHLPSGQFGANGAWFALNVVAHNLVRLTAAIALGESGPLTAKTFRRRLVALPGRLARSGRRLTPAPARALALGDAVPECPGAASGDPPRRLRPKPSRQPIRAARFHGARPVPSASSRPRPRAALGHPIHWRNPPGSGFQPADQLAACPPKLQIG